MGYKKDKTLVDEQELRRLQQMAFLQQHKDDVSRLPAEAQARLRDANYTLCKFIQKFINHHVGVLNYQLQHATYRAPPRCCSTGYGALARQR